MAVSIVLENGGENFQFLSEGIFITESFGRVPEKRGLTDCSQDGDANSGVGRDWYGWVSGMLCTLGRRPFFCRRQYPGMEGDLLLLFPL